MSKIHDLIRNADDRTMVDFRVDNQIDSVPIGNLRALLDDLEREIDELEQIPTYQPHHQLI